MKEIKEFIEMMEKHQESTKLCGILLGNVKDRTAKEILYDILVSPEYQALKAAIKDVNEINFVDMPTDTQDSGWIANPGKCPVPRETTVEVRWEDGDTHKDKAYYFRWNIRQNEHDIIAYRIIEEPKEQKKKCYHSFKLRADFNGECDKCGEPISREAVGQALKQEPKKLTLAEYCYKHTDNVDALTPMELIDFISEYLAGEK